MERNQQSLVSCSLKRHIDAAGHEAGLSVVDPSHSIHKQEVLNNGEWR